MSRVIFWDFHGTLCRLDFESAMQTALDEYLPDNEYTRRQIAQALEGLMPWDTPLIEHPQYAEEGAWWEENSQSFVYSFTKLGQMRLARQLAARTREIICDSRNYYVLPYASAVLYQTRMMGWRNIILSNHIPQLPQIVAELPIAKDIAQVITSGNLAYEKPHKGIYEYALKAAGYPERVWMVGDNYEADVLGAEACGIPAILVHSAPRSIKARFRADKLTDVADIISQY